MLITYSTYRSNDNTISAGYDDEISPARPYYVRVNWDKVHWFETAEERSIFLNALEEKYAEDELTYTHIPPGRTDERKVLENLFTGVVNHLDALAPSQSVSGPQDELPIFTPEDVQLSREVVTLITQHREHFGTAVADLEEAYNKWQHAARIRNQYATQGSITGASSLAWWRKNTQARAQHLRTIARYV